MVSTMASPSEPLCVGAIAVGT
ncbi:MAG: hypothetical protein QOE71_4270, partial [Pseudonocardiales bacterium]|nr:hypothetical protein [Pseudonocardiales bacterium]